MKIDLETATGYTIHSYGKREITINIPLAQQIEAAGGTPPSDDTARETLTNSLIITPETLIRNWPPTGFEEIAVEHIEAVADLKPELVLLGLGDRLHFPKPALMAPLIRQGIGVEYMDTPAACRTYNFLAAEGRRVAAAIVIA